MRVAVAGIGSFAKHFVQELPAAGHEVVVLTRSHKDFLDGKKGVVDQRVTDYASVPQLVELLEDCDALVSTAFDMTNPSSETHLNMLEACKQTTKCKRFIPAEYGGNCEDYPQTPAEAIGVFNEPLKEALRKQDEVEWTFISIGWVMDYIVPSANRIHPTPGPFYPLDLEARTMCIPGTGDAFSATSARDVTKAVAELLKSQHKWRPYTYVQGMETTWLELAELVKTVGGVTDLKISFESVESIQEVLEKNESPYSTLLAKFKNLAPPGRCRFDQEKVKRDQAEHFPSLHLRTAKELLEAVKQDPKVIV